MEATTLPSYEEAERTKLEEAVRRSNDGLGDSSVVGTLLGSIQIKCHTFFQLSSVT